MSQSVINPDQTLDTSGLLCPVPVIKTAKAIKQIEIGQVLKMISTDPGAPPDMEAWARSTKHELLESHEEEGQYIFYFRRTK